MFDTLADAYVDGIEKLLRDGDTVRSVRDPFSVASNFGGRDRPAVELLGHGFEVVDSTLPFLDSPGWQPRLDYYFGFLTWSLAGRDDTETLAYYHPGATRFSDDGAHLSGAFGRRLFRSDHGNQIAVIAERLRADPASRRAIALVLDPRDNFRDSREYPCAASVQFFLRRGRLHAIAHMRAQQALLVLPYDAFLFMAIQAALAADLEVEPGTYRHICGTFHIYADERELAASVRQQGSTSRRLEAPSRPIHSLVTELEHWEATLRRAASGGTADEVRRLAAEATTTNAATAVGQAARVFALKAARTVQLGDLADQTARTLAALGGLTGAIRSA
jgi:hypothetical protein